MMSGEAGVPEIYQFIIGRGRKNYGHDGTTQINAKDKTFYILGERTNRKEKGRMTQTLVLRG